MKNPTIHRFFLPNSFELTHNPFSIEKKIFPELFHQLAIVLRAQIGEKFIFIVNNGSNLEYYFDLTELDKHHLLFKYLKTEKNNKELPYTLNLALSVPAKPDLLAECVQKATELGAQNIFLVKTEFTQLRHQINLPRLLKIATEAAEQSERTIVPKVYDHSKLSLEEFIKLNQTSILVGQEREVDQNFILNKVNLLKFKNGITVLIGPEGGFSAEEKQFFAVQHLPRFSIGKTVLKIETAAIAALSIINYQLID